MRSKRKTRKTSSLIALSVIAAMLLVSGITIAYLFDKTGPVVNTFTPSKSDITIDEKFDGTTKSDVTVKNTGDVKAYVRAKVVITWKKGNDVLAVKPVKGTDYEMDKSSLAGSQWFYNTADGLYYYKTPLAKGTSTTKLIDKCTQKQKAPEEGYTLSVEILSEAIQAEPANAVVEAWGLNPQELGVK